MKIYVGNLTYQTTEDELRGAFAQYGDVSSVDLIKDRFTRESKGFGFVEMSNNAAADAAIKGLNKKPLNGRVVTVNQAKPRNEGRPAHHSGR